VIRRELQPLRERMDAHEDQQHPRERGQLAAAMKREGMHPPDVGERPGSGTGPTAAVTAAHQVDHVIAAGPMVAFGWTLARSWWGRALAAVALAILGVARCHRYHHRPVAEGYPLRSTRTPLEKAEWPATPTHVR
jgi:hypothetical protein